jgi:hypothetical protein
MCVYAFTCVNFLPGRQVMHETMDALSDAVLTSYAEEEAAPGGEVYSVCVVCACVCVCTRGV